MEMVYLPGVEHVGHLRYGRGKAASASSNSQPRGRDGCTAVEELLRRDVYAGFSEIM